MTREEWRAWLRMDEDDVPNVPWAREAINLLERLNDYDLCTEEIVMRWVGKGEVSPLVQLFQVGIAPTTRVLRMLGHMLNGDDGTPRVGYELVLKGHGKPGRRTDPVAEARDRLLADRVHERMQDGGYEAALSEVTALVNEDGPTVCRETVKKAYDHRYGKKR